MSSYANLLRLFVVSFCLMQFLAACSTSLSEGYPDLHDLKRKESDNVIPEYKEEEMRELQNENQKRRNEAISHTSDVLERAEQLYKENADTLALFEQEKQLWNKEKS